LSRKASVDYYERNRDVVKSRTAQWQADNPEKVKASQIKYRIAHPGRLQEIRLRHRLKKKYNITVTEYNTILFAQNNACAICKQPETNTTSKITALLAVDHNHTTLKIRGLLCKGCNLAIGSMKESPERLIAAAEYLRERA